jgi:hypothetical protein
MPREVHLHNMSICEQYCPTVHLRVLTAWFKYIFRMGERLQNFTFPGTALHHFTTSLTVSALTFDLQLLIRGICINVT